jgi:hypothetical protein
LTARALQLLLALLPMVTMGRLDDPHELLAYSRARESIRDILHPPQRAAVDDPHDRVCIWTTGRAGKSFGVLTDFVDQAAQPNDGMAWVFFYYCLSDYQVEEIAWPTLQWLDRRFQLGARFQEQKLRMVLPTGNWIRLFSFNRLEHLDRYYGIRLKGAALDEAAFAKVSVEEFVEDTLGPRLIDDGGKFYMMSIPGRTPSGLFAEVIRGFPKRINMQGQRSPTRPDWSVHSWTWEDNPSMRAKVAAYIAKKSRERPQWKKTVYFLRNYKGERVTARGERVYAFDRVKNTWWRVDPETGQLVSNWQMAPGDHYVLGMDFGYDDMTAWSLNVWRDDFPLLVEIESYKEPGLLITPIAARTRAYMEFCNISDTTLDIVADHAHKQWFKEFENRTGIPVMISEKEDKYDWIETEADDLALGMVKICDPDNSPHVKEMNDLTWKQMANSKKRVEQPGAPNDCCDGHLVAYRHAYHYLHEEEEPKPDRGTPEWYREEERRIEEELEELEGQEERAWYDVG